MLTLTRTRTRTRTLTPNPDPDPDPNPDPNQVTAALRRSISNPHSHTEAQSDAEPLAMPTVEAMVDDTLFPHDVAMSCLPSGKEHSSEASDESGDGTARESKVLRWADFLKTAAALPATLPRPAPTQLPPPLAPPAELEPSLSLPADSKWWGQPTLVRRRPS